MTPPKESEPAGASGLDTLDRAALRELTAAVLALLQQLDEERGDAGDRMVGDLHANRPTSYPRNLGLGDAPQPPGGVTASGV